MKEFTLTDTHAVLRYHDLPGDDIPLIFIHGLGCASSFDYVNVATMPALSGHRRILIDLLGSGYSDKPVTGDYTIASHGCYIAALLVHLQIEHCVVYGHSMGGAVAISLARRIPSRLQALILSEANLDAGGGFFSQQIARYSEPDFVAAGFGQTLQQHRCNGNQQWAASLAVTLPAALHRSASSLIAGETPGWRESLYTMTMARTFIFGSRSLPDPDVKVLVGHGIRIDIVADAGHSMAWENPAGLAAAIKRAIVSARGTNDMSPAH